jgi:hypothetical protein
VKVLIDTDPAFIRMRRIWLFSPESSRTAAECPLLADIRSGTFKPQTPEGTVLELRRLISGLGAVHSRLVCDHANNYLPVEGNFPADRERMLERIDAFLALPLPVRNGYYREVGSRI